jgi:hypothetical protein
MHIINLTVTQGYTSVNKQQTAGAGRLFFDSVDISRFFVDFGLAFQNNPGIRRFLLKTHSRYIRWLLANSAIESSDIGAFAPW